MNCNFWEIMMKKLGKTTQSCHCCQCHCNKTQPVLWYLCHYLSLSRSGTWSLLVVSLVTAAGMRTRVRRYKLYWCFSHLRHEEEWSLKKSFSRPLASLVPEFVLVQHWIKCWSTKNKNLSLSDSRNHDMIRHCPVQWLGAAKSKGKYHVCFISLVQVLILVHQI